MSMADIIDPYCVNVQMIKADKNNNTTANTDDGLKIIEIISPSEQCDVLQNGNINNNNKSENTSDSDDHHHSLNSDNNNTITNNASSSNDETEASTNIEFSPNPYKDFSGIDTECFITTTLHNNPKDRALLLTLEKVFQEFIQNEEQTSHQFQAMNSYERMIVHRVAAFFGLDHNVDKNGQSIIVTKTANTRIPNFSFQNFIPTDELSNGAVTTLNPPIENSTRRISHRNQKNLNQQTFITTKPSFERANHYVETREKISNQSSNKINRKQQRFNTNHHIQQTNIQPTSHFINTRTQPMYPSASHSYYPQQSFEHDFKQQTTSSPMYNYVPMMSPTSFQHGNGIQLPILLHQQPTGQIQYVFPTHSLQPQPPLSSDGRYMPVYRSDIMPPVVDNNNPYSQPPFVHLYPTHPYPHTQQTTFIQPAPSFMIPPNNNPTSIQYTTNQLATLNLQSQYDDARFLQSNNSIKSFVQSSSNGLNPMSNYHQYRQIRPLNTNHTDKQLPPIENDIKSTINNNSDQISLSGPVQEKD